MLNQVEFKEGLTDLSASAIATLYRRAPLLRHFADQSELWSAYEQSSLVLSAWYQGRLVGIARVLTDGSLFSYLCDLAVEPDVQRLGIGRALIDDVVSRCGGTDILLRDSSGSSSYYPKIGFKQAGNAWVRSA
jgi:GNAT superfamily N-acetyltransferase